MTADEMKARQEVLDAIANGSLENATPQDLQRWLFMAAHASIGNSSVQHTSVVIASAINHVQTAQVIKEVEKTMRALNDSNKRSQIWMGILSAVGVVLAGIQIYAAYHPPTTNAPTIVMQPWTNPESHLMPQPQRALAPEPAAPPVPLQKTAEPVPSNPETLPSVLPTPDRVTEQQPLGK